MPAIDVDALLTEISPESPCGENLEYDPSFQEMERAAQGKPEQQFGDTVVPAEDPDWKEVRVRATEVLGRSRDLRAAVYLASAALHLEGLSAFRDGLRLVHGLVTRYWPDLHPRLDPEDGNDPTLRINTIGTLCDLRTTIEGVKRAPLVQSRTLGRFGYRDIEIANGEYPKPAEGTAPEMATIEAAFLDGALEELQEVAAAVRESEEIARALDQHLTETLGTSQAPDLSALPKALHALLGVLDTQLARRGVGAESEEVDGAEDGAEGSPAGRRLTGDIRSREDVIRALDKIIDYYNRNEPSSPIPLLLMRSKGLVTKSFLEIMADLAPGGLAEAERIRGVDTTG